MINIIIPCTPNYKGKDIINTILKRKDMVSQFIILYNSIKKNWNFDYRINLFYNEQIKFNEIDVHKLSNLDIDIFPIKPDFEKTPYMLRCNALTHKLRNPGSHRLLLDCDTIALKEPNFDMSCDWQAMFAGSVVDPKYYEYINTEFNYNLDLKNKVHGDLFGMYMNTGKHENYFPHFNGGAFLIKEELCGKFKEYTAPSYRISHDPNVPHDIRHIGVQYGASFALMKMSHNWKPFEAGFNYLAKAYDINKFGKENIQLLHYCGVNGFEVAYKHFAPVIDEYLEETIT
tara:strand:+ start:6775 stop:7635 length:861 start_codon:yes stop_codon:yes gene_type:complete